MTTVRFAPLLAALAFAPIPALAGVGLGTAFPVACGSGYHPDVGGNCQPNAEETNRYCPRGAVFHTTFDGWRCDPAPREAY